MKFAKRGDTFLPTTDSDLFDTLPAGNYIVQKDAMKGTYFLEKVGDFVIPAKLYGDVAKTTERILKTFFDRAKSTGVLLAGEQGSGKTLLAKNISALAKASGIPTIIINSAWCGDDFNKFIQDISQPCIIIFDEFEKVYDREEQQHVLTLLDGVFPSKKLFIVTCNDTFRIDAHMVNRPGRLYYNLVFNGLDNEFIRSYCQDVLDDKSRIEGVCTVASAFPHFSFDILQALVEEMNRYDESAFDAVKMLNAKPDADNGAKYAIEVHYPDGREVISVQDETNYDNGVFTGNPLNGDAITFDVEFKNEEGDAEDAEVVINPSLLTRFEPQKGVLQFTTRDGVILTLTRKQKPGFDYSLLRPYAY